MKIIKGDRYTEEGIPEQEGIAYIRSGGQTGVDRGALDAARSLGVPIIGWVPKGGIAEDYVPPKSLCDDYPELRETENSDYFERTALNVRDAHGTLIIHTIDGPLTFGTKYTEEVALYYKRPLLITEGKDISQIVEWVQNIGIALTINVAGSREAKVPGIYQYTYSVISELLKKINNL